MNHAVKAGFVHEFYGEGRCKGQCQGHGETKDAHSGAHFLAWNDVCRHGRSGGRGKAPVEAVNQTQKQNGKNGAAEGIGKGHCDKNQHADKDARRPQRSRTPPAIGRTMMEPTVKMLMQTPLWFR